MTDNFDRLEGMAGVNWTAGGKLIYVGGTGTENSILESNEDGGNLRPIPAEAANPTRPRMTGNRRFLIFADKKGADSTIWRYETASGNLTQMTKNYSISCSRPPANAPSSPAVQVRAMLSFSKVPDEIAFENNL